MEKAVDEFWKVDDVSLLKVGTESQPSRQSLSATHRSDEPKSRRKL